MKLMLDSSFLIALILEKDQWHHLADSLSYQIEKHDTFITNIILAETMNSFQCLGGKTCKIIYNFLIETSTVLYITDKRIYDKALNLLNNYDASIGFSDCTTIKMMEKHNIEYIVSYDTDFDKKDGIIRVYNYHEGDTINTNIKI